MWWALQTVTTVGYGDVVPSNGIGKALGAFFMLEAIAFVAIVTAAITSSFVERARHERMQAGATDATSAQIMARLDELSARIEALRRSVDRDDHG